MGRLRLPLPWLLLPALLLFGASAGGWQLEHSPSEDEIRVVGERRLDGVAPYLVWADLDRPTDQWASWQREGRWRDGLHPIATPPMDLAPFARRALGPLPRACPDGNRCLLAMVAVNPGDDPLDPRRWLAASVHPLSADAAARLRLPGQRLFLAADADGRLLDTPLVTPAAGDTASGTTSDPGGEAATEKPDIFRLEGDRLLYANGPAERFQVIDVSDPANPWLEAWQRLSGPPRELYALNGHYVLMQGSHWGDDAGTRVTTLRFDADGELETVDELTLDDRFVESRRREGVIYAVTQRSDIGVGISPAALTVHALEVDPTGAIGRLSDATFSGYSPEVAIFPDHLVVTGSDTESWRATNVQLYDLSRTDTPLHPLSTLQVPGRIPSEFHLDVRAGLLRLVYGPPEPDDGSTLALYTIGADALAFSGATDPIAPGEALFATRFVGDTAYLVTFERTDPLWVVDLSDATAPAVVGELEVPGWSELLFFNDQRLFAVGIDDQPAPGESWAQRVAVSLFDVADPTDPRLLTRITPLVGGASYSHSPALTDERALLLDWADGYAALPISYWDDGASRHQLQLIDIDPDRLADGGALATSDAIQRGVELGADTLAALGEQTLTTLRRGVGDPAPLGSLELARNLTWIGADGDHAWVAGSRDWSYHRLYRYTLDDLETPTARWSLEVPFQGVVADGGDLLFYNPRPLKIQHIDDGIPGPLVALEEADDDDAWWSDRRVLLSGERLFLNETLYSSTDATVELPLRLPEFSALSTLRSWRLSPDGAAEQPGTITLPGRLVAADANGELLTLERLGDGAVLHHLLLEEGAARLLGGTPLPCAYPSTLWNPPTLYLGCSGNYWSDNGSESTLIRFDATDGFQETGRWSLSGPVNPVAASADMLLIHQYGYAIAEPMPFVDVSVDTAVAVIAPTESRCRLLGLSGTEPVELATPESCTAHASAITPDRLLQARGYAGIRETRW